LRSCSGTAERFEQRPDGDLGNSAVALQDSFSAFHYGSEGIILRVMYLNFPWKHEDDPCSSNMESFLDIPSVHEQQEMFPVEYEVRLSFVPCMKH
jgi:hypothetical protein